VACANTSRWDGDCGFELVSGTSSWWAAICSGMVETKLLFSKQMEANWMHNRISMRRSHRS